MMAQLKGWAVKLKRDVMVLWLAARDRRTPCSARLVAGATAAYALSPVDLIPDFIPVIGLLDDIVLVPVGIWLALRLIPDKLIEELRVIAADHAKPVSRLGLVLVIAAWGVIALAAWLHYSGDM